MSIGDESSLRLVGSRPGFCTIAGTVSSRRRTLPAHPITELRRPPTTPHPPKSPQLFWPGEQPLSRAHHRQAQRESEHRSTNWDHTLLCAHPGWGAWDHRSWPQGSASLACQAGIAMAKFAMGRPLGPIPSPVDSAGRGRFCTYVSRSIRRVSPPDSIPVQHWQCAGQVAQDLTNTSSTRRGGILLGPMLRTSSSGGRGGGGSRDKKHYEGYIPPRGNRRSGPVGADDNTVSLLGRRRYTNSGIRGSQKSVRETPAVR